MNVHCNNSLCPLLILMLFLTSLPFAFCLWSDLVIFIIVAFRSMGEGLFIGKGRNTLPGAITMVGVSLLPEQLPIGPPRGAGPCDPVLLPQLKVGDGSNHVQDLKRSAQQW